MKPRVAIQLYSVRDEAERDFEGTVTALKEMGYEGVELAGFYGLEPKRIGETLARVGLRPVSAHVPFAEMRADMKKVLSDYQAVGVKHIAVPYLVDEDRPENGNFSKTVEDINCFAKMAKEVGITLSYHNHDFEFVMMKDNEYALDYMYRVIPQELLCAELDTCWVKVAGEDPVSYVKKYASRSPLLHLKDYAGKKSGKMYGLIGLKTENLGENAGDFEFRPLGKGVQDMDSIVDAAEECGVEWIIYEQDEPTNGMTRMECARVSREWLKNKGY